MASISTSAPRGNPATCTVARAGGASFNSPPSPSPPPPPPHVIGPQMATKCRPTSPAIGSVFLITTLSLLDITFVSNAI